MLHQYILIFSCKDAYGILAKVTSFLSEQHAFIRELSEFGDSTTGKFFLRCLFELQTEADLEEFSEKFTPVAKHFQADWRFIESSHQPKTLILVSKFGHCLNDLLYRYHSKRLA